ncbi:MAG: hypothetical protein CVV27_08615 [Candidatus Melainabacteria bacterium HGW-Melainabacteria-1]|nr:MAG: hypothetical protein CVV27_08615 [Candidatus Melainabacteria bacterium HGW-Melainabacteria-1]
MTSTQQQIYPLTLNTRPINALSLSSLESPHPDPHAPLLLFLHGFPDTARVWEPLMQSLAQDYYLVAPFVHGTQTPANAKSAIPPWRYGLEAWCLDLLSLLKVLDPDGQRQIFVIAHDLGGPYAQALSEYLGPRCSGLVLINSLGLPQYLSRISQPGQWLKSYYILLFQLRKLPELLLSQLHPFSLNRIYDLGGVDPQDPLRRETSQVFAGIEQYRQIMKKAPQHLGKAPVPSEVPTLFIWGQDDPFLEIPSLHEAERFYRNVEVRVLPGNHWVLRGQAAKIGSHLQKFVQKWRSRP